MVSSSDNFTTPARDDNNTQPCGLWHRWIPQVSITAWARRVADILLGFGPNDPCSNRGEPVNKIIGDQHERH